MRSPMKAVFFLYCALLFAALLAAMPFATLANRDGKLDRVEFARW